MATKLREHYVYIPKSTLFHDKYKGLCQHAKVLYNYLIVRRHGRDDWFSYSYKEIKKDSGLRNDMIAKSIKQLAAVKFMEYEHGGLELNHNMYYLEPSWLKRDW